MRQCGGFYIELSDNSYKKQVYGVLLECLENMEFESDNFWWEYMSENLEIDYETFIDFEDYCGFDSNRGPAFVQMCKAIVKAFPELAFKGVSHWYNSTSGFMMDYIIHYNCKTMNIYSMEYCESDDWAENQCPECGSSHMSVDLWGNGWNNVVPDEVYCVSCGATHPIKKVADLQTIAREKLN